MIHLSPLFALSLLFVATLVRGWSVKRTSGTSAWAFTSAAGVQRLAGAFFAVSFLLLGFAAWHIATDAAASNWTSWIGAGLAASGTLIAVVAQIHLGNAWRVGVKDGDAPLFISTGLYRFSRNPIFMGMFIMGTGIALASGAWWAWLALTILIGAVVVLVGIEEEHLNAAFGDRYAPFKARVPRWIGISGEGEDQ